jgi:carotenoid cleavage dioxygenase-like enzyme
VGAAGAGGGRRRTGRARPAADDDHPYRSGARRPQHVEYDAEELQVQGELPDDLHGVYLRNTENPLHPAIARYHPFDGDGMIHKVSFRDGHASYRNRFVRTDGLLAEQEAGRSLWAGLAEHPDNAIRKDGWGARGRMKDAASTDVVVHAGVAVASFYQYGDLYRLDPLTLTDLGKATWGGQFPSDVGVSAHTKVDDHTGELLFFNYRTKPP